MRQINVCLSQDIVEQIKGRKDYVDPVLSRHGTSTGVSGWIRQLILRELALDDGPPLPGIPTDLDGRQKQGLTPLGVRVYRAKHVRQMNWDVVADQISYSWAHIHRACWGKHRWTPSLEEAVTNWLLGALTFDEGVASYYLAIGKDPGVDLARYGITLTAELLSSLEAKGILQDAELTTLGKSVAEEWGHTLFHKPYES